ncbi:hypothetical protein Fmac_017452 [Flemingia macrophylla]|uniref:Uncharacterized protein n=1 Tax=Flemingia macrophylla TaxID=520843 RepID=A0ABD1M2B6_9FABA
MGFQGKQLLRLGTLFMMHAKKVPKFINQSSHFVNPKQTTAQRPHLSTICTLKSLISKVSSSAISPRYSGRAGTVQCVKLSTTPHFWRMSQSLNKL